MEQPEGKKKFMSSVSMVDRRRLSFVDRTSPQKIIPHGFYSNNKRQMA